MFQYFFGIPTPDTGWGFPLRQGLNDTGVDSRRRVFGPNTLFLTMHTDFGLAQNNCKMYNAIDFEINTIKIVVNVLLKSGFCLSGE